MEPLGFGMQLPPSPPPPPADNTNQDSLHDTQLTMYFTQPPPPVLQPPAPPQRDNQDFNRETQLTMYFTQPPLPPVLQPPPPHRDNQDETQLTMYFTNNYVQESPPPPPPPPPDNPQPQAPLSPPRKSTTIPPPFPWATKRRAQLHTLKHLTDNLGIKTISGDVECKSCRKRYQIEYNLEEKFKEVSDYVANNKHHFINDRAPRQWMKPMLPTCNFCHEENSMKPVIKNIKKRSVNWLFLLLGQMIGCCNLKQLRYFCKHTGTLELCNQLDPSGPYVRRCNRVEIIR